MQQKNKTSGRDEQSISDIVCLHCKSEEIRKAGFTHYKKYKKRRFFCKSCRRYSTENPPEKRVTPPQSSLALELQAIAQRIGRKPTTLDIKELFRQGRAHSIETYYKAFGSFSEALKKARLVAPEDPELEKEILIAELRALYSKMKRSLLEKDVVAARRKGRVSSIYRFRKYFGSVAKALAAAGVGRKTNFSKKELITILRRIASTLDRPVGVKDIKRWHKAGKSPSHRSFQRKFGGVAKARLAAGVRNVYRKDGGTATVGGWQKYTPEQLIGQLEVLGKKLGRKPSDRDINRACKRGECASSTTFANVFGSLVNAYRKAGFEKVRPRTYTDREILDALRKLIREKGGMPTYREIRAASKAGKCPSMTSIIERFGKTSDLRKLFNL